ncbi:MAG TPA: hypothetical protein VLT36_14845, partial [Candidatus Dormibacteraeota bacterium]|nr:hypothetical protein [Candidatus Dormibacteraeota bacterium]
MSGRRWRFTVLLVLAVCTAMTAIAAPPEATPATKSTPTAVTSTNSSSSLPKPDGLRELEKSLLGPLEAISPKSSLDGVGASMHPLGPVPSQNRKVREELERRKDWVFMTPEQLVGAPSADDLLGVHDKDKDAKRKEKMSPLDSYIERLYNPDKTQKGSKTKGFEILANPGLKASARELDSDQDSDGVPKNVRESEGALKRLFSSDAPKDRNK